jgi:pimeloyl-ACP methyl ester carboxylesterase
VAQRAVRQIRAARVALCAALLLLTAGCAAPWKTKWVGAEESYVRSSRNVLSSQSPSEFTQIVLRRHNLLDFWGKDPDRALSVLHRQVVGYPERWPDLFALAELHYLRGRQRQDRKEWLAAAVYAYAYLFPGDPGDDRPNAFDPRFRQACDLYNLALAAAFTEPRGRAMQLVPGVYPLPFGKLNVAVDRGSFVTGGRQLVLFRATETLHVEGPKNVYYNSGLGAPLAATAKPTGGPGKGLNIAPKLSVPANLLMTIDHPRRQVAQPSVNATLTIHSIFDSDSVTIAGENVPLEYDQTASRALSIVETAAWSHEYLGFLKGALSDQSATRLTAIQPHKRGRRPVVLVHGTASSPFRWADMINDLLEDRQVRDHFEFWSFSYGTGNPIPYSAWQLRTALRTAIDQLGGTRADPALGEITVIGHSQGGLLTKMLVIDPGNRLWNGLSRRPLDSLRLSPKSKQLLRETLFPRPMPEVREVIFISTPHRGSYVAGLSLTHLLGMLVSMPKSVAGVATDLVAGNGDNVLVNPSQMRLGSVYGMSPSSPFIKTLAQIPVAPGVHAHSIIPVRGDGPLANEADGVVRYSSAHIEGVDSDLVVRHSGHSTQSNPLTIAEVRRILLLGLGADATVRPAQAAR